jgi:hypothetical protein
MATSPACSSVDVTTTWPKACRTRGSRSGIHETTTSFEAPGGRVALVAAPSTKRTPSRAGDRTSSSSPRMATRDTMSGSAPTLVMVSCPTQPPCPGASTSGALIPPGNDRAMRPAGRAAPAACAGEGTPMATMHATTASVRSQKGTRIVAQPRGHAA